MTCEADGVHGWVSRMASSILSLIGKLESVHGLWRLPTLTGVFTLTFSEYF